MLEINVDGIEGVVSVRDGDRTLGERKIVTFANGYQASIVNHSFSYGTTLAVMHDGNIVYDTPITDDVVGHLDGDSLREVLERIAALPKREPAMHFTYPAVQRAAQAVMARVGDDHKAISCTYVRRENGKLISVCFVGKILEELGVPLDAMEFMNSFNHERRNFQEYRVTFSDMAFLFLDTLQAIQDCEYEWGVAYQLAASITVRRNFRGGETLVHI